MVFTVHNSWFVFRPPRSGSRCRPGKSKRPTVRSGMLSDCCQTAVNTVSTRVGARLAGVCVARCVFCVLCDDGRGDKGCRHDDDDDDDDDDDAVYRSRRTSVVHAERGASSVSSSNRGKSLDDDASVDEVGDDVSGRSASCRHEGDLDYDDDDGRGAKGTGGAVRTETSTRDERVDDGGDRGRSGGTRGGGVDER